MVQLLTSKSEVHRTSEPMEGRQSGEQEVRLHVRHQSSKPGLQDEDLGKRRRGANPALRGTQPQGQGQHTRGRGAKWCQHWLGNLGHTGDSQRKSRGTDWGTRERVFAGNEMREELHHPKVSRERWEDQARAQHRAFPRGRACSGTHCGLHPGVRSQGQKPG